MINESEEVKPLRCEWKRINDKHNVTKKRVALEQKEKLFLLFTEIENNHHHNK